MRGIKQSATQGILLSAWPFSIVQGLACAQAALCDFFPAGYCKRPSVSAPLPLPRLSARNSGGRAFSARRSALAKRILWDATPTKINKDDIGKVYISLPPLEVQQRLVRVLDNFDSICSDLNIGLPAEIEARKKQYEFYRDALLTYAATDKTILTDRQTDRRV